MGNSWRERGGYWVLTQVALMLLVLALGLELRSPTAWPGALAAGAVLMFAGGTVALAGAVEWRGKPTPFPRPSDDGRLLRDGIYGFLRHPLYAGIILLAVGWGLFCSSWPALVSALTLALFFDAKARREERWLREKFPDYSLYERQVRRFIPWVY